MSREQFAFYPSLKSMPVIVSGGASGIGEEIVRGFAAQDSKVGFVDIAADGYDVHQAESFVFVFADNAAAARKLGEELRSRAPAHAQLFLEGEGRTLFI